nr:LTA synthase family protein [Bacillus infantis]
MLLKYRTKNGINMKQFKKLTPVWVAVFFMWLKTAAVSFIGFNLHAASLLEVMLLTFSPLGLLMLLIGGGLFWKKKVKPAGIWLIMLVLTGILYSDLLYYRFYTDFVTVPILFQFKNVGGLGPSTLELISPWDLLLFIDLLLYFLLIRKKKLTKMTVTGKTAWQYGGACIALFLMTGVIGLVNAPHLFTESYNRPQLVKNIGLYPYHLYDIGVAASYPLQKAFADASDAKASAEYVNGRTAEPSDYFGAAEGMNVVLISMESTQGFVLNQKVKGEEITPFLNSLSKDSFYFNNLYDQTAQGKTSDSEFMVDNGLYPLSSGSAFVRKFENTYKSLPHILKNEEGYKAAVLHGNEPTFWNREDMYKSLGYDRFFSKGDYEVTEENSVNYGIKDIPFFQQSIPHLKSLEKPYYTRFITLTNHFPFLLEEEDRLIPEAETSEMVVNRYVTTVRYQDEAIKTFFQEMKDSGEYDNTVFVLYGDHYGISDKYEHGVLELLRQEDTLVNRMKLQKIPLIIHIPGQEGKSISTIGGEIDIRATLLHLLGINPEDHYSFSRNLFARNPDQPVVFRDGSFIAEEYLYKSGSCLKIDSGEEAAISKCEPYLETARKELGMSDDVVNGDLLRFLK